MNKLPNVLIQFSIALIPLFFLPITRDFTGFNKHALIIALALVAALTFAIKSFKDYRNGKLTIHLNSLDVALFAFAAVSIASLFIASPNIVYSVYQPGGIATVVALTILAFCTRQLVSAGSHTAKKEIEHLYTKPLIVSAIILAVLYTLQVSTILSKIPNIPAYLASPLFSPTGSIISMLTFFGITIILAVQSFISDNKQAKSSGDSAKYFSLIAIIVLAAGIISGGYTLFQSKDQLRLLPQSAAWTITAESLSRPKAALFGSGPGSYFTVFTQEKPATLNSDAYWAIQYNSSSNFFFQTMSEIGLLGFAAFAYLAFKLLTYKHRSPAVLAILIALLFLPMNMMMLISLYILIMSIGVYSQRSVSFGKNQARSKNILEHAFANYNNSSPNQIVATTIFALALAIIAGSGYIAYHAGKMYLAEYTITQGIQSTQTNNHDRTYQLQLRALQLNPFMPDYRIIFANTNLALANLIAGSAQADGTESEEGTQSELTDGQRQTVTQLITQAINNGKAAVQLYPSARTWENLGTLYAGLIGVAQGAENWTVQSYDQAIIMDPSNPALRVRLGGVFYGLQQYQAAQRQFELAVQLKPDYANAWYNLANTYRSLENLRASAQAYDRTLQLIAPNSEDYTRAREEAEAVVNAYNELVRQAQEQQAAQEAQQSTTNNLQPTTDSTPVPQPEGLSSPENSPSDALNNAGIGVDDNLSPDVNVGSEESVNASQSGDLLIP